MVMLYWNFLFIHLGILKKRYSKNKQPNKHLALFILTELSYLGNQMFHAGQIQLAIGQKVDHRMYLKCPRKVIFNTYFRVIRFQKMYLKNLHIKDAVFFHAFLQRVS